ncbi:MAG: hypothetical protein DYG94_12550 [Leptolyngbya sp. PLA3]|nr:MAG: hypothetical protein EDM82_12905 [Cyanobacteria bacterium CYA]MCE7969556.1 hypothetical protein [Leptolyngbya sp. PL-A3]
MLRALFLIALVGSPSLAWAQATTLNLTAGSSISVSATLDTPVGSDSDSDSSPVTGQITIELDSYGNPTAITLHNFAIVVTQTLDLDFDYGFFGSVSTDVTGATANYGSEDPAGPVGVALDSTFYFPAILTDLAGTGTATGNILFVGSINETFNLADFSPFETDFAGSVGVSGDTVTLSGSIEFSGSGEVQTGVTMSISGTLIVNASGPAPEDCPADWNGDGNLDFFDVQGFLGAFSAGDQQADFVDDDQFNFFDVQTFLAAFSAGCP